VRINLQLPARYFLFVGRLVKEKGVHELLQSYAKLDRSTREQIGLVFVGDGASRKELEQQAASVAPGTIRFSGFAQREQLPAYYALADMAILPTYSDTWGLVVNEAMACGLPIIVSRPAGCALDLITDGWNGLVVPAQEVSALSSAMQSLASQPELRARMAANSRKRLVGYSPAAWANAIGEMLQTLGATH
jgi:1,2-diacylglycerol 3-alpha-glucosyltransferase